MGVLSVGLMVMAFSITTFFVQSKNPGVFISAEGSISPREHLIPVTCKTFSYFLGKFIKMQGRESTEVNAKRFLDISFLTVATASFKKITSYIPRT